MCLENSRTRFCVVGEILLSELIKGLGGLEKNTQYFKGERKKEDKKEEYS